MAKLVELEYKNMEMEEQSGFRAGRSCIDNILCITQLIEKKKATNRDLHLLFIDVTKAYDSVPLNILWETLDRSTINTFAASYLNTQGLNNSCLKSPTSTLVDLTFQSRALRSFSLNQLRNLSL